MGKVLFIKWGCRFGVRDSEKMQTPVVTSDKTVVVDVPTSFFPDAGVVDLYEVTCTDNNFALELRRLEQPSWAVSYGVVRSLMSPRKPKNVSSLD